MEGSWHGGVTLKYLFSCFKHLNDFFFSLRSWFSQGSSISITGSDFAMEGGGDRLPSERWSFFGPKAVQKSTSDTGMSLKICLAKSKGGTVTQQTCWLFLESYPACLVTLQDHLGNVC